MKLTTKALMIELLLCVCLFAMTNTKNLANKLKANKKNLATYLNAHCTKSTSTIVDPSVTPGSYWAKDSSPGVQCQGAAQGVCTGACGWFSLSDAVEAGQTGPACYSWCKACIVFENKSDVNALVSGSGGFQMRWWTSFVTTKGYQQRCAAAMQ